MRYLLLVGGALCLLACASSKGATDCDPAVEVCDEPIDAAAGPDSMPLKGFGEACDDRSECESNICILVGTGGICTDLCNGDDCPDMFGCLGVQDSVEPGSVDYVCVPLSTQLCTPCSAHTECALIGQDLCVRNALGDSFCGRDCSSISCPAGYRCDSVEVDNLDFEQCVPNSGYCDCVAENQGLTEACDIQTPAPFNTTCGGLRTCLGEGGWGGCEPPTTADDPDDGFTDSNCDGIDGDVNRGIFVAAAGSNNGGCGLNAATPCQTIAYGVVRAAQSSRPHVYVQTGTYNEVVPMVNGVSIYGGYNVAWQRGPYSMAAHRVAITGGLDNGIGGDGEYLVIRAHSLIVPVTIDNLLLDAPDATEAGKSSYGVHVDAAQITLTNVQVLGGNGAAGSSGGNGQDAISLSPAPGGGGGGNGDEFNTACNTTSRGAGGPGAAHTCSASPSSRNMNGGNGGAGGTMDTSCFLGVCSNCDATNGIGGQAASYTNGSAGTPGGGGIASSCGNAGNGNPGFVANGSPGGGGNGATVVAGYWVAASGTSGATGQNGGGGGGGGGAGGCDEGTDAYGGGGGGGGAGGCAARGGGGGGGGGGGSFGVFAVNGSTVSMSSCSILRGNGGNGGNGGTGGRGQPGGGQGPRGANPGAGLPGLGGAGAHGGHGGGGGGGFGGRSVGLAWTPESTVSHSCTITGGAAGSGGAGGVSAPAVQGTSEDDGFDGGSGTGGTLQSVRTCASAASC